MLRGMVMALGALLVAGAVAAAALGADPAGLVAGVLGVLILVGTVFERRVYRPAREMPPGPEWQRMRERFRDPVTGKVVGVWFNPATGQRSYVRAGDRPGPGAGAP